MSIVERLITVYDASQTIAVAFEQIAEIIPPFATLRVLDNFDEVSTTYLHDHTPDVGGPWTWNSDGDWSTASAWKLHIPAGSGHAVTESSSTNATAYLPTSPSGDVDVVLTLNSEHTSTGDALVYWRSLLTERTGYSFGFRNGRTLMIDKWTAGADTNIYTGSALATFTDWTIRLKMIESSITLWLTDILDTDTPVFQGTDTDIVGPDYVQLYNSGFSNVFIEYLKVSEY